MNVPLECSAVHLRKLSSVWVVINVDRTLWGRPNSYGQENRSLVRLKLRLRLIVKPLLSSTKLWWSGPVCRIDRNPTHSGTSQGQLPVLGHLDSTDSELAVGPASWGHVTENGARTTSDPLPQRRQSSSAEAALWSSSEQGNKLHTRPTETDTACFQHRARYLLCWRTSQYPQGGSGVAFPRSGVPLGGASWIFLHCLLTFMPHSAPVCLVTMTMLLITQFEC